MIRKAEPGDVARLHELILELAVYERLRDRAVGTPDLLAEHLFGEPKYIEAIVVEEGGIIVGYALFHPVYSSFLTRPALWIEDLYVQEPHRGKGYGKGLLQKVVKIAVERGMGRVDWAVLDWNQPSIDFYEALGAVRMTDWEICRLEGDALRQVAGAE